LTGWRTKQKTEVLQINMQEREISGNQSAKEKPLKCLQADTGAELNAMLHFILNRAFKGEL